MTVEEAKKIMAALSHNMKCPLPVHGGCTCGTAQKAAVLYAEAAKVVRDSK